MRIFSFFILFIFISNISLGFDLKKLGDSLQKDLGGALKELEKGLNQNLQNKNFIPNKNQNEVAEKKEKEIKFANRHQDSLKIEQKSLKNRQKIYNNSKGEIKNVFSYLENFSMKVMDKDLQKIRNLGGILNDFEDDPKHVYLRQSKKLFFKKLSDRSKKIESENDNLRLALDVLNYLYTGSKSERQFGVLSNKGCIFYKPSFMFSTLDIYDFNKIIPKTVKLSYDGTFKFQGDLPVKYGYGIKYYEYYKDVSDPKIFNRQISIDEKKSDFFNLKKDIDFNRATKAVRLLFSKSCKGAKESEF